ncbi:MAG: protein kinase, partial [Pseudomonadota bacterium]
MDEEDRFPTGGALDLYASATDGGDGADHPLIGRRLGEYEVTGLIARGGMGVVFSAERADGTFERDVAIKISSGDVMGHDLRDRFLREQAILASLNHPNICQLFDAGVTDEGWPYFVMEKVVGDSVADYCRERQLSPDAICALMIQIVDATAFAHARLVVHRDLKPSNVMVTADGTPKLLDFGIAKLLEVDAEQSTIRPMTPRYASPEQLLGREVTIASDLFQLGALLAELLTGRPLHVDETLETAVERAAQGRSVAVPAPPDGPLPRELRKIVEHCLRPDPENRYANATALQEDLTRYLQGRPVQAVGLTPLYRLRKFLKRNWVPVTGSLGAGLLIAAGVQLSVALLAAAPCGEPDGRLAGIWDT